jgi:transposase
MDGDAFLAYVKNVLERAPRPGDTVIMDNPPATRCRASSKRLARRFFYLAHYSPDLDPIEQSFSKVKALLRNASARSVAKLDRAIPRILAALSS